MNYKSVKEISEQWYENWAELDDTRESKNKKYIGLGYDFTLIGC